MDRGWNQSNAHAAGPRLTNPTLVGIVGGSCAGKTWLANALAQEFGGKAARISLDDFYRDRSHLSESRRGSINFDNPRAIDWPVVEQVLKNCKAGHKTLVPQYDFKTHSRLPAARAFKPASLIIVEGLWLFRPAKIRRLFDLKIFIRSPLKLCRSRRLQRDVSERGRSRKEVCARFDRMVAPMHERFVTPQERWADIVLANPPTPDTILEIAFRIRAAFDLTNPAI